MANNKLQTWELWYPNAAAIGLLFARCRIDPAEVLWVHAAPPNLAVVVRDGDDGVIARGEPLELVGESTPMTRLRLDGNGVTREDLWPSDADLGATVLLPGGEAGTLQGWWNAGDHSQWRWQVEFYNHR